MTTSKTRAIAKSGRPKESKLERLQRQIAEAEAAEQVKVRRTFIELVARAEAKAATAVKASDAYQTAFTAVEEARKQLGISPDDTRTSVEIAQEFAASLPPKPERKPRTKKVEAPAPADG